MNTYIAKENARNPAWTADYNGLGWIITLHMFRNLVEVVPETKSKWVNPRFKGSNGAETVTMSKNHVKDRAKMDIDIFPETTKIDGQKDGEKTGRNSKRATL